MIDAYPLTMECNVVDVFDSDGFDNFICSVANTYAAPDILDNNGKLDYTRLKPVLFEFPTYSYFGHISKRTNRERRTRSSRLYYQTRPLMIRQTR